MLSRNYDRTIYRITTRDRDEALMNQLQRVYPVSLWLNKPRP